MSSPISFRHCSMRQNTRHCLQSLSKYTCRYLHLNPETIYSQMQENTLSTFTGDNFRASYLYKICQFVHYVCK